MSDILASVSVVLGAEIGGFKAAMAQARKELKGLVQFSEGLKDIGSSLTTYVSAPLALLGAASVAASGKVESLKKGLEAITLQELGKQGVTGLGALQEAAQQTTQRMSQLEQIAKQPGLGFEGAVQGDVRLRAVGISAEQSAKSIKAFANAIATTGGGKSEFDRVTVQLAQLSAKGKVLAQDLRPIIEAAPAVSGALQRLYGTVDSETISASLAKQGKSSTDFIAVLTDELAKLPQVSGGLKNAFENLADTTTLSLAKLGDGISKSLNLPGVLASLSDGISRLSDAFAGLSPGAQKLIVGLGVVAAATGPVLLAIGTLGAALPAITAGFAALGVSSLAALGPIGIAVGAVGVAAALIIDHWSDITAYFAPTGEGGQVFSNLATSVSESVNSISQAFGQLSGGGNFGDLVSATGIFKAVFRDLAVGVTAVSDVLGGIIGTISNFALGIKQAFSGEEVTGFSASLRELERAAFGLIDPLANLLGFTKRTQEAFDGAAGGGGRFGTSLLQASGILTGFTAQLQGFAGGLPNFGKSFEQYGGILEKLRLKLKDLKEQRDKETTEKAIFSDNAGIKALEKEIARLEQSEKAGKKALDAITKLRLELSRLTALDNLLGNTPSELEVLERRSATLSAGLKTLVDAGVSTSSKAFQGFAADLVKTSQAADKLIGSAGALGGVSAKLTGLVPTTIGDTLPRDVARLLGDYAKKPIELPLKVLVKVQEVGFTSNPAQALNNALVTFGQGMKQVSVTADAFGSNIAAAFGGFDTATAKIGLARAALQDLLAQGFAPSDPAVQGFVKSIRQYTIEAQGAQIVSQGLTSALSGLGTSIGESLANGGNVLEAAGQSLLKSLASIGQKYGEFLIALGIADVATGFNAAKGAAEIAAGVGLIAASGLLGSAAGGGGGRAASSPTSSPTTSNYGQNSNSTQKIVVEVVSRLRGQDLVAIGQGSAYRNRVGG
jgi:tape measure domain-containing protein